MSFLYLGVVVYYYEVLFYFIFHYSGGFWYTSGRGVGGVRGREGGELGGSSVILGSLFIARLKNNLGLVIARVRFMDRKGRGGVSGELPGQCPENGCSES